MRFGRPRLRCSFILSFYFLLPFLSVVQVSAQHSNGNPSTDIPIVFTDSTAANDSSGISALNLSPTDATIFAFCIIFALITALQLIPASLNISKHVTLFSPKPTPPTMFLVPSPTGSMNPPFAVGAIFPIALFLATLSLFVSYILRAVLWGLAFNTNAAPNRHTTDLITVLAVFSCLTDVFIVMSCFSFMCYRIRRLCYCTCRPKFYTVKRVFDMILVMTIFILGMVFIGYLATTLAHARDLGTAHGGLPWWLAIEEDPLWRLVNLKRGYDVLMVCAAVEVGLSSVMLYQHAGKYLSVPDRKAALCLGWVISPLLILYTLFPFILHEVLRVREDAKGSSDLDLGARLEILGAGVVGWTEFSRTWDVGRVIVTSVTMVVVIGLLLRFGGVSLKDVVKRKKGHVLAQMQSYGNVESGHGLGYKA